MIDPCRVCGHSLAVDHLMIEGSYVQCQVAGCSCGKEDLMNCIHGVPFYARCTACEWTCFGREATPEEQEGMILSPKEKRL